MNSRGLSRTCISTSTLFKPGSYEIHANFFPLVWLCVSFTKVTAMLSPEPIVPFRSDNIVRQTTLLDYYCTSPWWMTPDDLLHDSNIQVVFSDRHWTQYELREHFPYTGAFQVNFVVISSFNLLNFYRHSGGENICALIYTMSSQGQLKFWDTWKISLKQHLDLICFLLALSKGTRKKMRVYSLSTRDFRARPLGYNNLR